MCSVVMVKDSNIDSDLRAQIEWQAGRRSFVPILDPDTVEPGVQVTISLGPIAFLKSSPFRETSSGLIVRQFWSTVDSIFRVLVSN